MMENEVICIVQARLTSTRLPNKVQMKLRGKTIIEHVYERLSKCKSFSNIIFAIPDSKSNDDLNIFIKTLGYNVFRGDEHNVFNRYLNCAAQFNPKYVVRATCDNPLVDWIKVDEIVSIIKENNLDYVSINGYPIGTVPRVFNFQTFKSIDEESLTDLEKEHVTPVFYNNLDKYKIRIDEVDFPKYRLSVDTSEDFEVMTKIYDALYEGSPILNSRVYDFLSLHPEIVKINQNVNQIKA